MVELSYKEPLNGNFNDCGGELVKEVFAKDVDYEDNEDVNWTQNDC